ncbi:MAG: hypothetical protein Q9169_000235 [Polycauliona sp. 2 TL-2023]
MPPYRASNTPGQGEKTANVDFWPDRKFNTAFFFLNRQINREFSDILWNNLGVEWNNDYFELDKDDVARFVSMKRLQRCKLILKLWNMWRPSEEINRPSSYYDSLHPSVADTAEVKRTVFGLADKLNRMPYLREVHLHYSGSEGDFYKGYFVSYRDGSIVRWSADDLVTVFGNDLRGMKKVQISGTLCCECAALLASAMERPKEALSDLAAKEPERCHPRFTVPEWSDKHRGWI